MYRYDAIDHAVVRERVEEFRAQVARRIAGELDEDQFKPLRLMNGVYLQLHAYMLRVAIPYGVLNTEQLRLLADIARRYDKGYGHFTTRQNIQFNWPKLVDIPDILEHLSTVEMHAIQTSGNCVRNTTTDPFAGAAADEIEDPRPWCEIIRQWSTLHPEFAFLPRKFKIAVIGALEDRAAIRTHDIGLRLKPNEAGDIGFEVFVGGGQGRTPRIAQQIAPHIAPRDLLSYVTAILRVYNLAGRRDNLYKARIKILVEATGIDTFREQVAEEFARLQGSELTLPVEEIARIRAFFPAPDADTRPDAIGSPAFARWSARNVHPHKIDGLASAVVSLKPIGGTPGDMTAEQMDTLAAITDRYAGGELRITMEQNIVLPHVARADLPALHAALEDIGLATPNAGLATDIVACPGLDYCNLANARAIPIAQAISTRLDETGLAEEAGALSVKISGCINACGHHHVANIGLLGVDKRGVEHYQITLGGSGDENAAIGRIVGPAVTEGQVPDAVERTVRTYLAERQNGEVFVDTLARVGLEPFKEAIYAS